MVDLNHPHELLKEEIDRAIHNVIKSSAFINGLEVNNFQNSLKIYLNVPYIVTCGNGTDALQLSLLALNLMPGDEVLVPNFTFASPAEMVALCGLEPVFCEVLPDSFNISPLEIEKNISSKTRAIIVVHLFGQCANMEAIMAIAKKYNIYVIEDAAQSLGAKCFYGNQHRFAGTIGHIGTTSFFPTKNLGGMGDGGAIFTSDSKLAENIKMLANHGSIKKYEHLVVGTNSRLDTMQASILEIKLKHLNNYILSRRTAANYYNKALGESPDIKIPYVDDFGEHTYNQYTIQLKSEKVRNHLQQFLMEKGIPTMLYYPKPLHRQKAFNKYNKNNYDFPVSSKLSQTVLSLPMHTNLSEDQLSFICENVLLGLKSFKE